MFQFNSEDINKVNCLKLSTNLDQVCFFEAFLKLIRDRGTAFISL